MSLWSFAKATLLNSRSPGCLWRHPGQAGRILSGAAGNFLLEIGDRLPGSGGHDCPLCGWNGKRFRTFLSADEVIPRCICPRCGSFDRQRHLVLGLKQELARSQGRPPGVLLGFSLSRAMRRHFASEGLPRCFRTDAAVGDRRFAPDFVSDLRQLAVRTGSVDWVFCSHVLEHIPDLQPCLSELARLLRPGGVGWVQVPLEPGLQRSRRIEIDPERAHAHAWQFGEDFSSLIARPQWQVTDSVAHGTFAAEVLDRFGIHPQERFWKLRRE